MRPQDLPQRGGSDRDSRLELRELPGERRQADEARRQHEDDQLGVDEPLHVPDVLGRRHDPGPPQDGRAPDGRGLGGRHQDRPFAQGQDRQPAGSSALQELVDHLQLALRGRAGSGGHAADLAPPLQVRGASVRSRLLQPGSQGHARHVRARGVGHR